MQINDYFSRFKRIQISTICTAFITLIYIAKQNIAFIYNIFVSFGYTPFIVNIFKLKHILFIVNLLFLASAILIIYSDKLYKWVFAF